MMNNEHEHYCLFVATMSPPPPPPSPPTSYITTFLCGPHYHNHHLPIPAVSKHKWRPASMRTNRRGPACTSISKYKWEGIKKHENSDLWKTCTHGIYLSLFR